MQRRDFLKGVAFGAAVQGLRLPAWGQEKIAKPAQPNVLYIFIDQLRADACGCYGGQNITTPHIDQLAAEGVRFTNGLSTCPVCTPYRGMVQTGRHPTHSGILLNFTEANPSLRCVAHDFGDAGYRTGFIGKWHLAGGIHKYAGLNEFPTKEKWKSLQDPNAEYVPPGPHRLGYDHWEAFNFHASFNNYWFYRDEKERIYYPGYETDIQIDQAIGFMKACQHANEPFYLTVAPHPPHPPFRTSHCPEGYLEKIPENLHWSPNVPENHPRRTDPFEARCYYAMSKNTDDNIGRIMKFLHESGLIKNTIVVLTSDHGEQHGSHNRTNKMVPYAESVNIPLIMRLPDGPRGEISDALYTPIDHRATLCGLAGLSAPKECDGIDLSAVCRGQKDSNREDVLMANYSANWDYFQTGTDWPEWRGVHTKTHTYVKWLTGEEELYDNLADPYQMNNLAAEGKTPTELGRFRDRLKTLLAEAHDDFRPGNRYAEWFDQERNCIETGLGKMRGEG